MAQIAHFNLNELFGPLFKTYSDEPYFGFLLSCFGWPLPVFKQVVNDAQQNQQQMDSLSKKLSTAKPDKVRELEAKLEACKKQELEHYVLLCSTIYALQEAATFAKVGPLLEKTKKAEQVLLEAIENSPALQDPESLESRLAAQVTTTKSRLASLKALQEQQIASLLLSHPHGFAARLLALNVLGWLQVTINTATKTTLDTLEFPGALGQFLRKTFANTFTLPDGTAVGSEKLITLWLNYDESRHGVIVWPLVKKLLSWGLIPEFTDGYYKHTLTRTESIPLETSLHPFILLKQYQWLLRMNAQPTFPKSKLSAIVRYQKLAPFTAVLSIPGMPGKAQEAIESYKRYLDQGLNVTLSSEAQKAVIADYSQHEKFAGGAALEIEMPAKPQLNTTTILYYVLASGLLPRFVSPNHLQMYLKNIPQGTYQGPPLVLGAKEMYPVQTIRLIERAIQFGIPFELELEAHKNVLAYFNDPLRRIRGIRILPSTLKGLFGAKMAHDISIGIHLCQLYGLPLLRTEDTSQAPMRLDSGCEKILEKLKKTKGYIPLPESAVPALQRSYLAYRVESQNMAREAADKQTKEALALLEFVGRK